MINQLDSDAYELTYLLLLENLGDVLIEDLSILFDVVSQFATADWVGLFDAQDGSLVGNIDWDGSASSNILSTGQSLAVGATGSVLVQFEVHLTEDGVFSGNASATGSSPQLQIFSDLSTDGDNPDPSGDGDPSEQSPSLVVLSYAPLR
jgi:hypothetical protein